MTATAPLHILWRDDRLIAVHKPAGWLVHRTGLDADEWRVVLQSLRDQLGQPVWPIHRLDKGTSGVLLMALDAEAASRMGQSWMAGAVRKHYVAMVRGWPPPAAEVDHPLVPDDAPEGAQPQPAQTRFERLALCSLPVPVDRYPSTRVALVAAEPLTGRRHQIRRHLKHLSHPIIGDATHGKGAHNRWWAERLGVSRLWLHAARLDFTHPFSGVPQSVTSPWRSDAPGGDVLNPDWQGLMNALPWAWHERSVPEGH